MFLPDRFIRGTCPRCGAKDQYGDSCESCGATYEPTDLVEPRSVLSGSEPVMKSTEHYFVTLKPFEEGLKAWMRSGPAAGRGCQQASTSGSKAACATGT